MYKGGESGGEKVREVNLGGGGVAVCWFKQVTSQPIARGSDPELAC